MSELQAPGAGLPPAEKAFLNAALKSASVIISDRGALRRFRSEAAKIEAIFENDESYDVFQALLIPRVIGIEDSSRNWSVAMILEHLNLVNTELAVAIDALSQGIVPHGEVDVALYKPDPEIGVNVLDRFQEANQHYAEVVEKWLAAKNHLPHYPTFPHPWFGPLNAHQWHVLAAFHQRIHRRQAQKIIAMLGVT